MVGSIMILENLLRINASLENGHLSIFPVISARLVEAENLDRHLFTLLIQFSHLEQIVI